MPSTGGTSSYSTQQAALNWQPCVNQYQATFAQSPQDLNRMFVGCSNGDVYVTSNGLFTQPRPTWRKVDSLNQPDLQVNAIAYSPTDVNTAYIAFAGSTQGHKLWKTTNQGADWFEITTLPVTELTEVWSISVNPLDAQKVYIFGPGGAFMSPNGGDTWTSDVTALPLNAPIAAGAKLSAVSVAPGKPDVIWVGATNGDIYFTLDATATQKWFTYTWAEPMPAVTHLTMDNSRAPGPVQVFATFDGCASNSIWVTSNNAFGWGSLGNHGLWTTATSMPGVCSFYGISVNPIDPDVLYINGTYGVGFSTSLGNGWTSIQSN
jgi:hypothetical protein